MSINRPPNTGPWSSQMVLLEQLASTYCRLSSEQFQQRHSTIEREFAEEIWALPAGLQWWHSTTKEQKMVHLNWSQWQVERRLWHALLSRHDIQYPIFGIYPRAPIAAMIRLNSNLGSMTTSMQTLSLVPHPRDQGRRNDRGENSRAEGIQASSSTSRLFPAPYAPITFAAAPRAPSASLAPTQAQQGQRPGNHWPILGSTGGIQYSVTLPKGILPYIHGPASNPHSQLQAVELEFECGVQWANSSSPTTIELWAQPRIQGQGANVGVRYCARFLKLYRLEVTAVREAGRKGPRIDEFLQAYLSRLDAETEVPSAQAISGPSQGPSTEAQSMQQQTSSHRLITRNSRRNLNRDRRPQRRD
ncbi:hypothetical protein VTL71DRAFT_6483 [Oculimacula yallundae]|uniref:Uncharacterized protein n=1 Tax=Oculimacula yallundae TaxID=86028 RepID=A0ABR4BXS8_9HELO